ncbi:MAG TPA: efflux RND transporter periplasmic adaptor subunit [Planctomycetota bacterium]|nr:efflux RND transporter periplasmic adaptor subunit [Planctomycetota bacterium]
MSDDPKSRDEATPGDASGPAQDPPPADPEKPSRWRRLGIAVAIALALGAYVGYRIYLSREPYEWSGTVEIRTMSVGSRAGGRVKEVRVREGEPVAAGQALLVIESGDWPAQLAQAEGQLAEAQAALEKLERGARPEELEEARARALETQAAFEETRTGARREQIAAREALLAGQEVALEKAQRDARRIHTVMDLGSGAVAQADVDAADLGVRAAQAARDASREQLAELKNGSRREDIEQAQARAFQAGAAEKLLKAGSRVEDIAQARGQVAAARGKVDQIRVMIEELVVRAPRAARVEACDLRPGDLLAPSAIAATLLEEDQLYVRIYVPETQIGHLRVGQTVPITVDSFPGKRFEGVVERINQVGEFSPRNLQTADERANQVFGTRIGIRTGREELRAGMAAFIRIPK